MQEENNDISRLEEIEKYVSEKMGTFEKGLFEHKLSQDESLKEDIEKFKILTQIIHQHRAQELKEFIRKNAPAKFRLSFWQRVAVYSSAAIIIYSFIAWYLVEFYFQKPDYISYKTEQKQEQILKEKNEENAISDNNIPKETNIQKEGKTQTLGSITLDSTMPLADAENIQTDNISGIVSKELPTVSNAPVQSYEGKNDENYSMTKKSDDLKVMTDELMLDTVFSSNVFALNTTDLEKTTAPKSLSYREKNVAEKTKTQEKESAIMPVYVEFWRSPINYKGYRYNGKKLQLFGIANPRQVRFVIVENNLYLVMNKQVFQILREDRYDSYWQETDKNILKIIKP